MHHPTVSEHASTHVRSSGFAHLLSPEGLLSLYQKYSGELIELARMLRGVYHAMQKHDYGTTFGDIEGEVMYMLVRETKPKIVFEISPNTGWSTNYLLAALTRNAEGTLHSFELATEFFGKPTEEVIRGNQHPNWNQSQLHIHIGDARETVKAVPGDIDFLLLDSCHDDWFAEWYLASLLPRAVGTVMIQDIAFADGLELSGEARVTWNWVLREHVPVTLVGAVERIVRSSDLRAGVADRRTLRSNSIIFPHPFSKAHTVPSFDEGPATLLAQAREALTKNEREQADALVSRALLLLRDATIVNRHRLYYQASQCHSALGNHEEALRCMYGAVAAMYQADRIQRFKMLPELCVSLAKRRYWRLLLQMLFASLLEPGTRLRTVRALSALLRSR